MSDVLELRETLLRITLANGYACNRPEGGLRSYGVAYWDEAHRAVALRPPPLLCLLQLLKLSQASRMTSKKAHASAHVALPKIEQVSLLSTVTINIESLSYFFLQICVRRDSTRLLC